MSERFVDFAREARIEIEAELERWLPPTSEDPPRLHRAMRYSVFAGGKRVRPALVLLAGEAFDAPRDALRVGGAALELIHTFSLVHDDLPALDDDDLRRGRPTAHREFDEAMAILAGDALLTLGLQLLISEPATVGAEVRTEAASMVARAVGTGGMIGGQVADLEAECAWPASPAEALAAIHARKTGALLSAALGLGGVYGEAGAAERALLVELGSRIGLLFQIRDDMLDVEGATETLGKTAGKDAEARKLTYPALHGLEGTAAILASVRDEAVDLIAGLPKGQARFRSLIDYLCRRDR